MSPMPSNHHSAKCMVRRVLLGVTALTVALASAHAGSGDASELERDILESTDRSGREVVAAAERVYDGYGSEFRELTLTLVDSTGKKSRRRLEYYALEGEKRDDKTVVRFTEPVNVDGTRLLTHEVPGDSDLRWIYLPQLGRVRRIASADQSGAFMGSEFAYEDLTMRELDEFTFTMLGKDDCGERECYVYRAVPKNEDSGYSKVIRWRYADNAQERRSEYYDRRGDLLKIRRIRGYRQVDGNWRPRRIVMENVQTARESVIRYHDLAFAIDVRERQFSSRRLDSGF